MSLIQSAMFRRLQIIRLAVRLYRIFKRIQRLEAQASDPAQVEELYTKAGRSIRETAYRLCGAIVKAGQFLSLRQELFPEAFTRELQGLQDKVPHVPFAAIQATVEKEWKRPLKGVFSQFDEEPIASASLAQVHRAQLTDGRSVAVKVLRPGIEQLVDIDLSTLGRVVRVIDRISRLHKRMDFVALHKEFSDTLGRELDMNAEADHMHRFRQGVGFNSCLVIPAVLEGTGHDVYRGRACRRLRATAGMARQSSSSTRYAAVRLSETSAACRLRPP